MRVSLRTFLMWLLMLAVPLQGMAAATMALCGPDHSIAMAHGSSDVPIGHVHAGDHHADHEDGMPDHHHPAHADEAPSGAATSATPAHGAYVHADDHKCSVCASCHAAAAIVTSLPTMPAYEPAATVFAAVVLSVAPFAADGLERPPKPLLA